MLEFGKRLLKRIPKKLYFTFVDYFTRLFPEDIDEKQFISFSSSCSFLIDSAQSSKYVDELIELSKKDEIIAEADKICGHIFNLLGSGDMYLGEKLPWNKDFKTGFEWKNKFYKNIKTVDLNNTADVKVPWELSRFQHIFTLGKAFWLTGNEDYAKEFKGEIEDWLETNPVKRSVNWTCTMDVGIRAVNWITGCFFFKNSQSISKEFWNKFNKSLYIHGRFIFSNLENKGGVTGNHYLSDIVGLVWLGIYFGDLNNDTRHWLEFGLRELEKEMLVQVNVDGTNYEASTSYHRLVTELFLVTTILASKNGISFSKEYRSRLEKMCDFIMDITKPNGQAPLIGDADDGRLLIPSRYCSWDRKDFRHVLALAGDFFNRDDFRYYGKEYSEDALWLMGSFKKSLEKPEDLKSKAYSKGGYYILKNDRIYCLIRCGELSFRGKGIHSHNDQLSFELNVEGEDFIVDPGVFVYTADFKMRNLFRSTEMHSTISIDGYEQNFFEERNLFYMKEQTFAQCTEFYENKFVGRHYGYKDKCGIIHQRTITIEDNAIEVMDELADVIGRFIEGLTSFKSNFILDEGVEAVVCDEGIELRKKNIRITLKAAKGGMIKQCLLAKGYGVLRETKKIEIYDSL